MLTVPTLKRLFSYFAHAYFLHAFFSLRHSSPGIYSITLYNSSARGSSSTFPSREFLLKDPADGEDRPLICFPFYHLVSAWERLPVTLSGTALTFRTVSDNDLGQKSMRQRGEGNEA